MAAPALIDLPVRFIFPITHDRSEPFDPARRHGQSAAPRVRGRLARIETQKRAPPTAFPQPEKEPPSSRSTQNIPPNPSPGGQPVEIAPQGFRGRLPTRTVPTVTRPAFAAAPTDLLKNTQRKHDCTMESDLEYEVPFDTRDAAAEGTSGAVADELGADPRGDAPSTDAEAQDMGPQGIAAHDVEPLDAQRAAASWDTAAADGASEPFVGRWNRLISSTNWEKGRIISQWRAALEQEGTPATAYSDEAWARQVGGVTAPHVGRLRRVFDRFGEQHETYPGLYWSHFLAALDWDDAPLWLEGAMRSGWSVSQMRQQRWEASGAPEAEQPRAGDIVTTDTDEDIVMPAQGGGSEGRYQDEPDDISAGPVREDPDFGDEPSAAQAAPTPEDDQDNLEGNSTPSLVQPFAGLPSLPSDLSEALEMFKLSIIRHKGEQWRDVAPETVIQTLDALKVLVTSRSE